MVQMPDVLLGDVSLATARAKFVPQLFTMALLFVAARASAWMRHHNLARA
jgi:hypothetical protein